MHTDRKKPEVTTSIILEKRVTNKEGKHPVKLRVTYQRKRKYYTLKSEYYTISEFSNIFKEKARGNNKVKRKKFDIVEDRAIHIIDNVLSSFSFDAFEREFKNNKKRNNSIHSYFNLKVTELEKENKIQTATLYKSTLVSLTTFDKNINFQKITPQYLKKYEKWMLADEKSHATIGMYLRNLKCIINLAIKDNVTKEYPFGRDKDQYSIPKSKNIKKALTLIDIEKLFNYETENRNEFLALQYWLFSYLCNGMNMVDIANLKYKNIQGKNLKFIRQKTKDTSNEVPEINVYLLPESVDIIKNIGNENLEQEGYIFPIFKSEFTEIDKHNRLKQHIKLTNKYIKRIARNIGIDENITTYWARHSYSTILKRSGAPIEFISEQLGHQSTRVTANYLDSFEDEQREKYSSQLLGFKKNKSEKT